MWLVVSKWAIISPFLGDGIGDDTVWTNGLRKISVTQEDTD